MTKAVNPYPGPTPFTREQEHRFFGRTTDVRNLRSLLHNERIVVMHGPSGAGKTSLIQAGLAPRMEKEDNFLVLNPIRVHAEPPGIEGSHINRYVLSALSSLESLLHGDEDESRVPGQDTLAGITLDSYFAYRSALHDEGRHLLVVFDQFEEIFTTDAEDYEGQLEFFMDLARVLRDKRVWALLSMREEYVVALDRFKRLLPGQLATRFQLNYLTRITAGEAIATPAERAGVPFADDAVERLLDDLSGTARRDTTESDDDSAARRRRLVDERAPVIDPLHLQLVCQAAWKALPEKATEITQTNLDAIRRSASTDSRDKSPVESALEDHYDVALREVAGQVSLGEQRLREWIEDELIEDRRYRRQVIAATEDEGLAQAQTLLKQERILRDFTRNNALWLELAHDRLVPAALSSNETWAEENLSPFVRKARKWSSQDRPRDFPLPPLREIWRAHRNATELPPYGRGYLEHCSRILRGRGLYIVAPLLLIAAGTIWYIQFLQSRITLEMTRDTLESEVEGLETEKADLQAENERTRVARDAQRKSGAVRMLSGIAMRERWISENHDVALLLGLQATALFETMDPIALDMTGLSRLEAISPVLSAAEAEPFSFSHPGNGPGSLDFVDDSLWWVSGRALSKIRHAPSHRLEERCELDTGTASVTGPETLINVVANEAEVLDIETCETSASLQPPDGRQFDRRRGAVVGVDGLVGLPLDSGGLALYRLGADAALIAEIEPFGGTAGDKPAISAARIATDSILVGDRHGKLRRFSLGGDALDCTHEAAPVQRWARVDGGSVREYDLSILAVATRESPKRLLAVHRGSLNRTRGGRVFGYPHPDDWQCTEPESGTSACAQVCSDVEGVPLFPDRSSRLRESLDVALGRRAVAPSGEVFEHARFSPDGAHLVTGGADGGVVLWDLTTLTDLNRPANALATLVERAQADAEAAATPDDGQPEQTDEPLSAAVQFQGIQAALQRERELRDPWAEELLVTELVAARRPLRGMTRDVRSVAVAPDGGSVAALDDEGNLRIWEMARPRTAFLDQAWSGQAWPTNAVALFARDAGDPTSGVSLITTHNRGAAQIWDIDAEDRLAANARENGRAEFGNSIRAVAVHGDLVAFAHRKQISVLDVRGFAERSADRAPITRAERTSPRTWQSIAFAPGNPDLRARWDLAAGDSSHVWLWGLEPQGDGLGIVQEWELDLGNAVTSVAFHPTEPWLVAAKAGGQPGLQRLTVDGAEPVIETGSFVRSSLTIRSVAFNRSGDYLVVGGDNGEVRWWELTPGAEFRWDEGVPLRGASGDVLSVTFLTDTMVAAAGGDNRVSLWSLPAPLPVGAVRRPGSRRGSQPVFIRAGDFRLNSVSASPDGTMLAAGDASGRFQLWDLDPKRLACKLAMRDLSPDEWPGGMESLPAGQCFAHGDGIALHLTDRRR